MKQTSILKSICLSLLIAFSAHQLKAQVSPKNTTPKTYITIKPLSYLLGANLGVEQTLSSSISLCGDLTYHGWHGIPDNLAASASLLWYLPSKTPHRFYIRGKAIFGGYFDKVALDTGHLYAGGGVGFGASARVRERFKLWSDFTLQFAPPFGAKDRPLMDGNFGTAYYSIMSPASLFEINIGFAIGI